MVLRPSVISAITIVPPETVLSRTWSNCRSVSLTNGFLVLTPSLCESTIASRVQAEAIIAALSTLLKMKVEEANPCA
jgi:hypothetical protein